MVSTSPITSRQPFTDHSSPAVPWPDIVKALDRNRRHRAADGASASQDEALQMVMAELVRGRPGIKPEEPLAVEAPGGCQRAWLTCAWAFDDGFFVVEVTQARPGSPSALGRTRYEFVPMGRR